MKSLLKFLGLAAVIVLAGLWIMTVSKSCNKNKTLGTTELAADLKDNVTEVTDDVESLFEGETEEEGLFNEEGDEVTKTTADEGVDEMEEEDEEDRSTDLQKEIAARENANNTSANNNTTSTSNTNSSGMEYLVIGGAFLTEANAKAEVARLKKKGYEDAEVVVFDFSQYHSVCVQRTGSLSAATSAKKKLIAAGHPEAYVHKKRRYIKK